MRDYDPEANKEVGASPKSSAPPTADSQAGDDIKTDIITLLGREGGFDKNTYHSDSILKAVDTIAAYAERRATEARIDELKRLPMSHAKLNDTSQYYTDAKAFNDRISALTKEIQSS